MRGINAGYAILQYGTVAERLAIPTSGPNAPLPLTEWFDTDTGNTWKWYGDWYPYYPQSSNFNPNAYGRQVGPAGTKTGILGGIVGSANSLTNPATTLSTTSRLACRTPAGSGMSDFVCRYSGWSLATSPTTEIVAPNSVTINAYLEYNGVSTQMTFDGVAGATIAPGADVFSDPVQVSVPANATYYIRTYVVAPAGGSYFQNRKAAVATGEGTNGSNGADIASSTGNAGISAAQFMYTPSAISAKYQKRQSCTICVGDSIACGAGEAVPSTLGESGFFERAISNTMPYATNYRGGTKVSGFNLYHKYRLRLILDQVTSGLSQLGVNDIFYDLASFATMQAEYMKVWMEFYNRGIPISQTTITPFTTTNDGWTTVSGQTTFSVPAEAVRVLVNEWLRTVPFPLRGIIDLADAVESSRNSGLWRVDLGVPTGDGLHPNVVLSDGPMKTAVRNKQYLLM